MNALAVFFGFIIAGIGLLGAAAPTILLEATPFLLTNAGLYSAAAFRIIVGVVLLAAAAASRMPRTLRVLGALIVLGGIVTLFIGVDRAQAMVDWWAALGPAFMRGWAFLAVLFGSFIIHASRRAT